MNEILFSDFLQRLSEEIPSLTFEWSSVVKSHPTDVIFTVAYLRGNMLEILTKKAQGPYGKVRTLPDVPVRAETVAGISKNPRKIVSNRDNHPLHVTTYV